MFPHQERGGHQGRRDRHRLWKQGIQSSEQEDCPHRERGAVRAVGVNVNSGRGVFPLQEVHAACQVSADVVQQAQRIARAKIHIVYEHQPVRVPPRQLPIRPLQPKHNDNQC